jgi:hypothetical protein
LLFDRIGGQKIVRPQERRIPTLVHVVDRRSDDPGPNVRATLAEWFYPGKGPPFGEFVRRGACQQFLDCPAKRQR